MSLEAFLLELLSKLIEVLGPALVRQHVDQYEAARKAADLAEDAKFGPRT